MMPTYVVKADLPADPVALAEEFYRLRDELDRLRAAVATLPQSCQDDVTDYMAATRNGGSDADAD